MSGVEHTSSFMLIVLCKYYQPPLLFLRSPVQVLNGTIPLEIHYSRTVWLVLTVDGPGPGGSPLAPSPVLGTQGWAGGGEEAHLGEAVVRGRSGPAEGLTWLRGPHGGS